MWILVSRELQPDAPYWPGRRWLAVTDAVAWPFLWVVVFSQLPAPVGLVGPMVIGVALLCGLARLRQALWENHRYRFTTWRWAWVAAGIILLGTTLKLALPS